MRIGITCYPTYGGSGVVATELGQELAARGHDVHFISYAPPIRMNLNDPHIFFHEVEVASYPLFDHPPYALALATKMLEVFEAEALDLTSLSLEELRSGSFKKILQNRRE